MLRTRPVLLVVVACLLSLSPFGVRNSTQAQGDSWQSFWRQFTAAVNKRDRVALKALMSSERDFFSGGGGENRDEWIQMIEDRKAWRDLQRSVASGTVAL